MTHNFKELKVWQKSRGIVADIYRVTAHFPKEEMYGLCSQLRRSAVSIPSNIAEGSGYSSLRQFIHFLDIAHSSAYEVETQLYLATDLGYLSEEAQIPLIESITEIQKMLSGLKKRLKATP